MSADIAPKSDRLSVIYDGECPFCNCLVKFYAIRKNADDMDLINARERPALVQELRSEGMDINDGMIAIWRGGHYHGPKAMRLLSTLGGESGNFATVNKLLFRNRHVAGAIYPMLAAARRLTLLLLRRKLIPENASQLRICAMITRN